MSVRFLAALLALALPATRLAASEVPPVDAAVPRAAEGSSVPGAGGYGLTLVPGLSGYCRAGWVPVYVAIDAGRDFTGDLVVVLRSGSGDLAPALYEVRSRVELAAGSVKNYHLYVRHESPGLGGRQEVQAYLQSDRGVVSARVARPLSLVERDKVLLCVVSDRPGVLRGLAGGGRKVQLDGKEVEREFLVIQPALTELPDRGAGYSAADFVLLCQTPLEPGKLGSERFDAIVDYVRGGGAVVLAAGDLSWFGRRELGVLAPGLKVSAMSRAETERLAAGAGLVAHRFEAPGFSEGSPPGFCIGGCGLGRVVLWSLDPDSRAVRSWDGLFPLWLRLDRRFYPERPASDAIHSWAGAAEDQVLTRARVSAGMLDLSRERSVSTFLVMLIVVLYLVMVGPVNHLVLRRLDMRALSIATIPLLAAVFVLLTFAQGYMTRGVTTVGRRVTAAMAASGDRRADCLTYQSIFPAASMVAEVSTDSRGLICPLDPGESRMQERTLALQPESGYVLRRALSMWAMTSFEARSTRPLGGSLRLEALGGGRYRLVNRTPLQLEDAFLTAGVNGGQFAWIGTVERNRTYEGKLVRYDRAEPQRDEPGSPALPPVALPLAEALPLWIEDGAVLSRGPRVAVRRLDGFPQQAGAVIMADPRLALQRRTERPGLMLVARVRQLDDFEPLRLNGGTVRGEALGVLIVLAEREAQR